MSVKDNFLDVNDDGPVPENSTMEVLIKLLERVGSFHFTASNWVLSFDHFHR